MLLPREEFTNANAQPRKASAMEHGLCSEEAPFPVNTLLGLPINLNLSSSGEDDPILFDAGFSVKGSVLPVELGVRDGDFDHKLSGRGMSRDEVRPGAVNDCNVRLRFRVRQRERLLFADEMAGRQVGREQIIQKRTDRAVQWRFGHFFDNDAANKLRPPAAFIEFAQAVVLFNRERGDSLSNFRNFQNRWHYYSTLRKERGGVES